MWPGCAGWVPACGMLPDTLSGTLTETLAETLAALPVVVPVDRIRRR